MNVLNKHLQNLSGKYNLKKISDNGRFFANPVVKSITFIALAFVLFTGLYVSLHLTGTYFEFSFYHKGKGQSFSFPLQSKGSTIRTEIPAIPVKTAENIDSAKSISAQAVDSIQTQPLKPVKTGHHKRTTLSSTDPSLQSSQTIQNSLSGTTTQSVPQPVKNDPMVRENQDSRIPPAPNNPQMP